MSSFFTGSDLLTVFDSLNIQLLNLSPNVIKAWFDTDCVHMKNLLNWMCCSLSERNYVSPLENSEYSEIEMPLVGQQYEEEIKKIVLDFPGILDLELNILENEYRTDELELLLEEENSLDNLIVLNQYLNDNLAKELTELTSKDIQIAVKYREAQENCYNASKKLDEHNESLHKQLVKYGSHLYNFEFDPAPKFINNMVLNQFEENFKHVKSFVTATIETDLCDSVTSIGNKTCQEISNPNDSLLLSLNTVRNRILHSQHIFLANQIEIAKLREILNFVNKYSNLGITAFLKESPHSPISMQAKEQSKKKLCEMLDGISSKQADFYVSQTKLRHALQEYEAYQTKLNYLSGVLDVLAKFLSQYVLIAILHIEEKKDIDGSDQFFRKILNYISKDIQNCMFRTEKMREIIGKYEVDMQKPEGEKMKLIKSIVKILSGNDFTLNGALEVVGKFKTEINMLENRHFSEDPFDNRSKDIQENIKILEKFLICGPTNRVVLVPSSLQYVLRDVEEHLNNEINSVTSAVQLPIVARKKITKRQNYERQLWMYFLTNPSKMFFLLQQVEEECNKDFSKK